MVLKRDFKATFYSSLVIGVTGSVVSYFEEKHQLNATSLTSAHARLPHMTE